MPLAPALHLLGGAFLAGLLLLGTGLQRGWWRGAARVWHHALFFAAAASGLLAAGLWALAGRPPWAALPYLTALLLMPRTRPGSAAHWRLALLAAGLYAVSLAGLRFT